MKHEILSQLCNYHKRAMSYLITGDLLSARVYQRRINHVIVCLFDADILTYKESLYYYHLYYAVKTED